MKSNSRSEMDEKKRKRMISNRESARRSRMKRQKHMEELINEKASLEGKINEDNQKYVTLCQGHSLIDAENKVLREEKVRLAECLKYLNRILGNCKGSTEYDSDLNLGVSESLNPSQAHGSLHPITASGLFTF